MNACKRDLEDFTRLQIRVDAETATKKPFEYYFKIVPEGSTTPSANLFEAKKYNQFYLHPVGDESALVNDQLSKRKLATAETAQQNSPGQKATINFQENEYLDHLAPYLLEGRTAGKGKIVLTVKGKDQWGNEVDVYTRETAIDLEDIKYFYDQYLLDLADYNNDLPNTQANLVVPASYAGDPLVNDYILFVHGWNWEEWQKQRYQETMLKRLWWLGYKGRMGLFIWPNKMLLQWTELPIWAEAFDRSELRAFRSAQALRLVLSDLKNNKGYRLHVLAHSQGNVIVSEAIRQEAIAHPTGIIVDSYIAAQAALPGHCYDKEADPMTIKVDSEIKLWTAYQTPNVYAFYYSGQYPSEPYFKNNKSKVGKMFNYFNRDDYALGWWQKDQMAKPDMGYGYEGSRDSYGEGDRFFNGGTLNFENDRYIIFARCAESRSLALGQIIQHEPLNGFKPGLNLKLDPLKYDDEKYSHSREFRSNIIAEWPFWMEVKSDFGF